MELFKYEWCNLYMYTSQGSAVYHIKRDRAYWNKCWRALADFWWDHIVPGRIAISLDDRETLSACR